MKRGLFLMHGWLVSFRYGVPAAGRAVRSRPKTIIAPMNLQLLGGISAPQFLARHWQKKPLLVRNAVPGFTGTLEATELLRLASRQDVESRLVRGTGTRRSLEHGPFPASRFRSLPPRNWTLLVQGLNLHV